MKEKFTVAKETNAAYLIFSRTHQFWIPKKVLLQMGVPLECEFDLQDLPDFITPTTIEESREKRYVAKPGGGVVGRVGRKN